MRRPDNLRRRPAFREQRPCILIVCEGTRTEPGYFKSLRTWERIPIELEIDPGGTPKTLVARAAQKKRDSERHAKKDTSLRYEEVWCVFDVDEHPFLPEAKQQAKANGIQVAISNPCFELWVLLHFQDQRASLHRDEALRLCRKHIPGYEKDFDCIQLHRLHDQAAERAVLLDKWQDSRQNAGKNPSTGVYRLTRIIKNYGSGHASGVS